jgi:hypothetical protein
MPMTAQQRTNAALKAAATKRWQQACAAAAAAGLPPPPRSAFGSTSTPPPPRPTPPPPPPPPPSSPRPQAAPRPTAFTAPKPTVRNQRQVVVAALEDLFVLVMRDSGLGTGAHAKPGCCPAHDDARKAFDGYKKALNRALAPSINVETQNEADAFLRLAAISLIKVTF